MSTNDDHRDWIERVNDEGVNLTKWEEGFMINITDQFERSGRLSPGQIETLEKIYAERTP